MRKLFIFFYSAAVCASACLLTAGANAASITEPATVFYGKIIGTGSEQPFLVTTGVLEWVVRRADGVDLKLQTTIRPQNDPEYSYQLNVPHEALAAGLTGSTNSVPLGITEQTHTHFRITVDGLPTRILGPNGSAFYAAQALRAATYRLDLQVDLDALDSDGNGLPDWWEELFELGDPNGDADGDGVNNLGEYRRGSDPKQDDRSPVLITKDLRVYAEGTTALLLRTLDSDSAASDVRYTLLTLPVGGALYLRNPDQALGPGSTFTQADVNQSRVVYVDEGGALSSFQVAVADGLHPSVTNTVNLHVYRPVSLTGTLALPSEELPWATAYQLSREENSIAADASSGTRAIDLSTPSSTGGYQDRPHVMIGGAGNDHISGSSRGDTIFGGAGDDRLRGNGGSDLFVINRSDDGNDIVEDFSISENDAIDISHVLNGSSTHLANYVRIVSNSVLQINFSGQGNYSDMSMSLGGPIPDLFTLVEGGHLLTGNKVLPPRINIAATVSAASENGPASGEFTITRTGSADSALNVNLLVSGSAGNGVDYRFVAPQVTFLAGQPSMKVEITPYIDALTELSEVVEIILQPGADYEIGTASRAQVTLLDLMPVITIEALEPLAVKSEMSAGLFLVTRRDVNDRSVLVRLNVGGSASTASDYQSISGFVNLQPWQTSALIPVTLKSTAAFANGVEFVEISLRPDSTYRVGSPATARVMLVDERLTFADWRERNFAGSNGDIFVFANQDFGQTGIRHIARYAFGLDPIAPQHSTGGPAFQIRDDHLTVSFRRPVARNDVRHIVEVSDDLVTWYSGENFWTEFAVPEHAGNPEMVSFRATQSVSEHAKFFMRVRVIYAP